MTYTFATDSNTPLMISSSPGTPDRQLLTASLTAPWPRHFVAVTYIFREALIAAVNFAPQSGSSGENAEVADPRKRTMFIGTIASGSRWRTLAGEGFRRSKSSDASMKRAISRANSMFRLMMSDSCQRHPVANDEGTGRAHRCSRPCLGLADWQTGAEP